MKTPKRCSRVCFLLLACAVSCPLGCTTPSPQQAPAAEPDWAQLPASRLEEILRDRQAHADLRWRAGEALLERKLARGPNLLAEVIRDDTEDLQLRQRLLRSLADCYFSQDGDPEIRTILEQFLQNRESWAKGATISTLREFHRPPAAELLLAALTNSTVSQKLAAISGLGRIGDQRTSEALLPFLRDEDREVRWTTVRVLDRLGCVPEAVPALIGCLSDSQPYIRQEAAEILFRSRDERALAPLITLAHETVAAYRQETQRRLHPSSYENYSEDHLARTGTQWGPLLAVLGQGLGSWRDERVVDPLLEILSCPDRRLREHAVRSLASLDNPRVPERLLAALQSRKTFARLGAAQAFCTIVDERARTVLSEIVEDDDSPAVQQEAFSALLALDRARAAQVPP